MANKKKMQKFHAMRRGEQRYGLSMNTEMYNGMVKLITEGSHRVFHMEKQSNRVSICAVHYENQWIAVAYDKERKSIASILPREALIPYKEKLETYEGIYFV